MKELVVAADIFKEQITEVEVKQGRTEHYLRIGVGLRSIGHTWPCF